MNVSAGVGSFHHGHWITGADFTNKVCFLETVSFDSYDVDELYGLGFKPEDHEDYEINEEREQE